MDAIQPVNSDHDIFTHEGASWGPIFSREEKRSKVCLTGVDVAHDAMVYVV